MIVESPLEMLREAVAERIRALSGMGDIPVLTRREYDFLNRIERLAGETGMICLVHLVSAKELSYQTAATTYEATVLVQIVENPSLWQVDDNRPGGWSVASAVEGWIKLARLRVGNQEALLQQDRALEEEATAGGLFIVSALYKTKLCGSPRTTT